MTQPIAYMRDLDGSGSLHACAKNDLGAFPVFAHPINSIPVEVTPELVKAYLKGYRERGSVSGALQYSLNHAGMDYHGPQWARLIETAQRIRDMSEAATDPKEVAFLFDVYVTLSVRAGMLVGSEANNEALKRELRLLNFIVRHQCEPQVHPLTCGNYSTHPSLMPYYDEKQHKIRLRCTECAWDQAVPSLMREAANEEVPTG